MPPIGGTYENRTHIFSMRTRYLPFGLTSRLFLKKGTAFNFCRALTSLIIAGVVTRFDFIGFSIYPLKSFYNLFRADTAKFPRPMTKHSGCAVLLLSSTDHIDRSFIISSFPLFLLIFWFEIFSRHHYSKPFDFILQTF